MTAACEAEGRPGAACRRPRFSEVRGALRADREHWRQYRRSPVRLQAGYQASCLYRLSRYAFEREWRIAAWFLWIANIWWTGADITPSSQIGGGLYMPQPNGVVIAGAVGRCAALGTQVVIGGLTKTPAADIGAGPGLPVLGDCVTVESRASVLGPIRIGDGSRIGPGCVVRTSIYPGEGVELIP